MTLSQLLTQIAALAPIREHTLPQEPEAMQASEATRPTRHGRPMTDTQLARLSMSLWQKLNLVQALAPAVAARLPPPPQR